ncbi:RecQ family ATP-dependent DNA helicase [Marinigracilibium pacificum]|uniref:ATP-dependent DNA helicase RecQ n=1 Tax=Marinigracilibium pacificum TaxID=2729599 RepID=A0A848IWW4_9BACT|nr:ATP-dependent DNA helicase RecQ [Marinigracilibium pacificum]NMM49023.1 RecQ family ATP-dependent DNA helicase [Marinigracilibium pacificum]
MTPEEILRKYWGYSEFRPKQRDIIGSLLNGKDVLALLPTGGGKSICYQVPALLMPGLTVVISPLIALMKDQVETLKRLGIPAASVQSSMSGREVDVILDNAVHGAIKILYVSPERVHTKLFIERMKRAEVSMIAVDEAHCISQWGHDFRPSYLQIKDIFEYIDRCPVIAVTATATTKVREEISELLELKSPDIYMGSFARTNLSLSVRTVEDKERKLEEILKKIPGSGIVYANSRKQTAVIARYLYTHNITANYYHAGLKNDDRNVRQDDWLNNRIRIISATNAFGMGIDKPDVRVVIHYDLPGVLEGYYQEAGRAGRDGKNSFGVLLLYPNETRQSLERFEAMFPDLPYIKKVYQAIANFYKLAIGSAEFESYDIDLTRFCDTYSLDVIKTFKVLELLSEHGLMELNAAFHTPSKVKFEVSHEEMYKFMIANSAFEKLLKTILRMYGGEIYTQVIVIDEFKIAQAAAVPVSEIHSLLLKMSEQNYIYYVPKNDNPKITFLTPRLDVEKLPITKKMLENQKEIEKGKIKAVIDYAEMKQGCRMQYLQEYFGEKDTEPCGRCDLCLEKKKLEKSRSEEEQSLENEILDILSTESKTTDQLVELINFVDKKSIEIIVRQLIDWEKIRIDHSGRLTIVNFDNH